MKKTIRESIFETNSSSTHSICVTRNNILDEKSEVISFSIGEFGWERNTLNDKWTKASYLYTGILDTGRMDLLDNIKAILDKNNIKYDFETPKMKLYNNNGKIVQYLVEGYIDHCDQLNEFLTEICNDENKLMRYLFSSESFIITGNDNEDINTDICVNYEHDEYYKGN